MTPEEIVMQAIREVCNTTTPERFAEMNITAYKLAIKTVELSQPSLPSNLDEAAQKVEDYYDVGEERGYLYCHRGDIKDAFKAGAKWYDNQMKMPNSSELISAWRGVKSILQEKDFRGDEWRLAYNAFMFGFSKGLNTRTKKK